MAKLVRSRSMLEITGNGERWVTCMGEIKYRGFSEIKRTHIGEN